MLALDLPPPSNWQDFESLCYDLWRLIWGDPEAQKNGRLGQPQAGVDVLRKVGTEHTLPWGLLARAALRRVYGERTSAEADLAEAEEIAERGHMLLHLADVHLERTLLHLAYGEDACARERLDAATELVERCGY